jgi:glycosyltransferase involved in cell wall biosynthesis
MITARTDTSELAQCVVHLLRDTNRRRQLGTRAREFAMQFSSERAAAMYLQRFEELLSRHTR